MIAFEDALKDAKAAKDSARKKLDDAYALEVCLLVVEEAFAVHVLIRFFTLPVFASSCLILKRNFFFSNLRSELCYSFTLFLCVFFLC